VHALLDLKHWFGLIRITALRLAGVAKLISIVSAWVLVARGGLMCFFMF
jgi:hypothetical protein